LDLSSGSDLTMFFRVGHLASRSTSAFMLAPNQPIYNCFEKDPDPVNTEEDFLDHCEDYGGKIHYEYANITTCCECIRYECVPSAKFNGKEYFYWNMTISEHCCLHCDGTVYKSDSVIESVVAKDECGTTKTSVCRKNDDGLANIEVDVNYEWCCNDEDGIFPINTTKLEPATCSETTCQYSRSSQYSSWISIQKLPGCNCCVHNGSLVGDGAFWYIGGERYECCEGKIVKSISTEIPGNGVTSPPPATSPSPSQAPVPSPSQTPVPSPSQAPVASPSQAPVASPSQAPAPSPTQAPVPSPARVPSPATVPISVPSPAKVPISVPSPAKVPISVPSPAKIPISVPSLISVPSPTKVSSPVRVPSPAKVPSPVQIPLPASSPSSGIFQPQKTPRNLRGKD